MRPELEETASQVIVSGLPAPAAFSPRRTRQCVRTSQVHRATQTQPPRIIKEETSEHEGSLCFPLANYTSDSLHAKASGSDSFFSHSTV